jgi:hypothetical protein
MIPPVTVPLAELADVQGSSGGSGNRFVRSAWRTRADLAVGDLARHNGERVAGGRDAAWRRRTGAALPRGTVLAVLPRFPGGPA